MTQTSQADSLHTLLNSAFDLAAAIGAAMDAIKAPGPQQPEAWLDLKVAFDGANLTASQLYQLVKRQRAADEPIPYTLADSHTCPGGC